jgi:hypothetical protein
MEREPGHDPDDRGDPDPEPDDFGDPEALEGTIAAAKERAELLSGFAPAGAWDGHPPGPELAAALARAAGPRWRCAAATGEELIGLLRAMAALQSWASAGLLGVIRALIRDDDPSFLGRRRHGDLPDEWDDSLVHEIALALAVSAPSAAKTTRAAWELGARLPGTEALLRDGTLDMPRARLIAEVFQDLSDEDAARAEELLLPQLPGPPRKTYTQIERLASAIAVTVDPGLAERRRKAAERHLSRVRMFREQSGTAGLSGRDLPTDRTLAAFAHVDARARQYGESGAFPGERIDRLRATAYLDILNEITADDRIAYGRLSPEDADADADDGDDLDEALAEDGPGPDGPGPGPGDDGPGLGGSDCPCRECDGRCAPPDDSDFPDEDPGDDDRGDDGGPGGGGPPAGEPPGGGLGNPPRGGGPGDGNPGNGGDSGTRPGGPGDDGPGPGGGDDPRHKGGCPPSDCGDPDRGDPDPDDSRPGGEAAGDDHRPGTARIPPRSPFPGPAGGPPPTLTDLVVPLATLLGQAERPGEGHGLGTLDPALCRALATTAALSPHTTVCVTVTDPGGIAIGHGCAASGRPARPPARPPDGPPGGPALPLAALPARINLTITAARLAAMLTRPDTPASPDPPGARAPAGWTFAPRVTLPARAAARTRGTTIARSSQRPPGDPDWCRAWTLTLPGGLERTVSLEPVPTFDCDHRNESHAYKPNATLRHLVQIRDCTCTFPSCSRHARESDFEHAVPYDQGGRTCGCNAGARSRKCHRVKQSPGWNVTQPKPGWHQWTTPRGRTYTQGPKQYPV